MTYRPPSLGPKPGQPTLIEVYKRILDEAQQVDGGWIISNGS